ncbi:DNA polymerase III subunit delta [Lutibacter sp. B2]|nr:DNA polymerase III subunit delta [Lutibacter sp. B2]
MNYIELLKSLKEDKLEQLYLFCGKEYYLIEKTISTIKDDLVDKDFQALNYQLIDGQNTSVDFILNACETLPFMREKRVVIIKNFECFFSKRKNINEDGEKKIAEYLSEMPKSTYLFFLVTEEIDKRKKLFKSIKKCGRIIEFNKLSGTELHKWIVKMFKKRNKSISNKEGSLLIEVVGYEDRNSIKTLKDLENEIEKLSSYVGERDYITCQDIETISPKSLENNIFTLVESIGENKTDQALLLLNDMLLQGESEVKILYMIIRQFRHLYQIKLMINQGYTNIGIGPKLKLQPFVVTKYIRQVKHFNIEALKEVLEECLYTDANIKQGKINPRLGIELLIGKFSKTI